MISENAVYWIWITNSLGYNNIKVKRLYELYDDIKLFYSGGMKEWRFCGIFTENELRKLEKETLDKATSVIEKCNQLSYSVISIDDEQYPECLINIDVPPAVIYVSGNLPDIDNQVTLSVVGTRRATRYGVDNAFRFGYALAKCGAIIVSGGALGVDCASHRGALSAKGITVCVLGCGINYKYLPENEGMRKAIALTGAVISEYPPDEPPMKYNFPARNRIISALSDGVIVMEAGRKSGSLITANIAIEQGKEVFALLGNNNPQNEGSNSLVKAGCAHPVTDFMDVLNEFNKNRGIKFDNIEIDFDNIPFSEFSAVPVKGAKESSSKNKTKTSDNNKKSEHKINNEKVKITEEYLENLNLSDTAIRVYKTMSSEPLHIDVISKRLDMPVFKVLTIMSQLEIKGLITPLSGRRYVQK
ncbi:MAG: DNA-processing protein DprA [Ruminococcus sp.]|nr:DNA-processing protein DprA [Ruminococcus sp.]